MSLNFGGHDHICPQCGVIYHEIHARRGIYFIFIDPYSKMCGDCEKENLRETMEKIKDIWDIIMR